MFLHPVPQTECGCNKTEHKPYQKVKSSWPLSLLQSCLTELNPHQHIPQQDSRHKEAMIFWSLRCRVVCRTARALWTTLSLPHSVRLVGKEAGGRGMAGYQKYTYIYIKNDHLGHICLPHLPPKPFYISQICIDVLFPLGRPAVAPRSSVDLLLLKVLWWKYQYNNFLEERLTVSVFLFPASLFSPQTVQGDAFKHFC